ncbi:oleosin H2-like [Rhodamnia argentea]|uniref:Oleosin H2-like n=1 Tax=Rhodamnia argentea TaxID=178133 RepID=A0A8B8NH16_9MYRT|nr:oleosin H2-like [Rhodamnia argentea]
MAEHHQPQQLQTHPHRQQPPAASTQKLRDIFSGRGPSTVQVLTVVTLVPLGGVLLLLAGLTFAGALIGLAVAAPLFVLFSPVLIPAALTIGLAVVGFLTSGAFGITGLASLTWMLRRMRELLPEQVEPAKRKMQDTAGHLGYRTKDVGQTIQEKAHDEGKAREAART